MQDAWDDEDGGSAVEASFAAKVILGEAALPAGWIRLFQARARLVERLWGNTRRPPSMQDPQVRKALKAWGLNRVTTGVGDWSLESDRRMREALRRRKVARLPLWVAQGDGVRLLDPDEVEHLLEMALSERPLSEVVPLLWRTRWWRYHPDQARMAWLCGGVLCLKEREVRAWIERDRQTGTWPSQLVLTRPPEPRPLPGRPGGPDAKASELIRAAIGTEAFARARGKAPFIRAVLEREGIRISEDTALRWLKAIRVRTAR